MSRSEMEMRALHDFEEVRGCTISVRDGYVSRPDHDLEDGVFPDAVIVRIVPTERANVLRWTDKDHLDPIYEVETVGMTPECQAVLGDGARVVAVYGPGLKVGGIGWTRVPATWQILSVPTTNDIIEDLTEIVKRLE